MKILLVFYWQVVERKLHYDQRRPLLLVSLRQMSQSLLKIADTKLVHNLPPDVKIAQNQANRLLRLENEENQVLIAGTLGTTS